MLWHSSATLNATLKLKGLNAAISNRDYHVSFLAIDNHYMCLLGGGQDRTVQQYVRK